MDYEEKKENNSVIHCNSAGAAQLASRSRIQGHRSRMRERLLTSGASALADYEILEMLFFLGVPRGDTKALAKNTIDRFGSLAAVLAGPPRQLRNAPGVEPDCVVAIEIVQEAALRLAQEEAVKKPLLNNQTRVARYLEAIVARQEGPHFRVLFLNTRNQLLADEVQTETILASIFLRKVIERALELHATALILVNFCETNIPEFTDKYITAISSLRKAAAVLTIMLHDYIMIGSEGQISLKGEGLI